MTIAIFCLSTIFVELLGALKALSRLKTPIMMPALLTLSLSRPTGNREAAVCGVTPEASLLQPFARMPELRIAGRGCSGRLRTSDPHLAPRGRRSTEGTGGECRLPGRLQRPLSAVAKARSGSICVIRRWRQSSLSRAHFGGRALLVSNPSGGDSLRTTPAKTRTRGATRHTLSVRWPVNRSSHCPEREARLACLADRRGRLVGPRPFAFGRAA